MPTPPRQLCLEEITTCHPQSTPAGVPQAKVHGPGRPLQTTTTGEFGVNTIAAASAARAQPPSPTREPVRYSQARVQLQAIPGWQIFPLLPSWPLTSHGKRWRQLSGYGCLPGKREAGYSPPS